MTTSQQLHSAASERNKGPITQVLQRLLASRANGHLLEISSGTGQHAAHFGSTFPSWRIQPSDCNASYLSSIPTWTGQLANVAAPLELDVTKPPERMTQRYDVVYNANMIHISPWPDTTTGLMRVTSEVLKDDGILLMYGPYVVDGVTAPSNKEFSKSLRRRDASWGVRELREVEAIASAHGLRLREVVEMPANNLCVVYGKGDTRK